MMSIDTGSTASIGLKWAVSVDGCEARVENRQTGDVFWTSVYRFPIGNRVGQRWTNGVEDCTGAVPVHVQARARSLARTLS